MFQDKKQALFSIHQIAQMGVSEGKLLGQWIGAILFRKNILFSPNRIGGVFDCS